MKKHEYSTVRTEAQRHEKRASAAVKAKRMRQASDPDEDVWNALQGGSLQHLVEALTTRVGGVS